MNKRTLVIGAIAAVVFTIAYTAFVFHDIISNLLNAGI
jgi:hypothetical protein